MSLTREQESELALMVADNAVADSVFRPGNELWKGLCGKFHAWMDTCGIGDIESQPYNSYFACYPPDHRCWPILVKHLAGASRKQYIQDQWYARAVKMLYDLCRDRDKWGIMDAVTATDSPMNINVGDRSVSWDYLTSVNAAMSIVEVYPRLLSDEQVVVDLGAGWGRMGHILRQVNSRLTYVDCDVPETLLIAQEYLPRCLPDVQKHVYSDVRNTTLSREALSDASLWFCAPPTPRVV